MTATATPRILLLEDNLADAKLAAAQLTTGVFAAVVDRVDTREAFAAALEVKPFYDLILADFNLPGFDGFGALKMAHECCPLVPFVFLSGQLGEELAIDALRKGATDYVLKHRLERLVPAVARALTESRERTERLRAEAALRESERQFRELADAMPQIVWAANPDGVLDYYNRRWFEYVNLPPDAGDEAQWDKYVHPDDKQRVHDAWIVSLKTGQDYALEFRVHNAAGEFRWFLVRAAAVRGNDGAISRWFGTCTDVHEQKSTADALRHSREQVELVVQGANVGVWYCPLPFDKLIWDETVKAHFHLPPTAEVTIDTFYQRIHPDDRERTRKTIDESISRKLPYDIDYRTVSADGKSEKWIRANGRGFYDPAGNPTRFDGITVDVTDRVKAQEERERLLASERIARTEAERASRLKDEFLATLSHELRTPLNAILGWAQLLGQERSVSEDTREGLRVIERNAKTQAQLIEDLLDMSRIISGKVRLDVQRVDLVEVLEAAYQTVRPAADAKGVRVRKVLDPQAGPVSGDPNRLQQVIWNLLTNAVKFTPRDGKVDLLLARINSHVEITIHDTGEGIAPEFLPHVFDRFRQADGTTTRKHGGLGLGLSIVKNLVELHGGTVRAKSGGMGGGATFIVELPLAPVRPEAVDAAGGGRGGASRHHPTASPVQTPELCNPRLDGLSVLVVDDDLDAREIMRRILSECGAEVLLAGDARTALDLLKLRRPGVLVSDIGMPDHDGYDLIRWIRALPEADGGRTPALALTAFARSEDRRRAVAAGYQLHLAKPAEPAELVTLVGSLAGRTMNGGPNQAV